MISGVGQSVVDGFLAAQQGLFERLVQPLLFASGAGNLLESAYEATGWFLLGLVQLLVLGLVFQTLERWRPVEAVNDRATVRLDMVYTVVHRLGLFKLLLFFSVDPLWDALFGRLHLNAGLAGKWTRPWRLCGRASPTASGSASSPIW